MSSTDPPATDPPAADPFATDPFATDPFATGAGPTTAVRLIASDLDGTLLDRQGRVSPRTRHALARAVAAGVTVVLVTARPPRFVDRIAEDLNLDGLALCANGAMTYDLATRRVVEIRPLDLATARALATGLRMVWADIGLAVETGHQVANEPLFLLRHQDDVHVVAADLDELWRLGDPIVKLLAWSATVTADDLLRVAVAAAGDSAECTYSGGRGLIEVSAAGVSKATALAGLCDRLGVAAAEVVAFGDMPNDLAMLTWAGAGYAMANAHPTVLAVTHLRAEANVDDGVARIVERLIPGALRGGRPAERRSWS